MNLKRLTYACLRYYRYQVAQRGYIYCMRKKEWFQLLTKITEMERLICTMTAKTNILEKMEKAE